MVAALTVRAQPATIVGNGADSALILAVLTSTTGAAVPDGTVVVFSTDLGTFANGPQIITATTSGGQASVILTAPVLTATATAHIHAVSDCQKEDSTTVIALPGAISIKVYDAQRRVLVEASDPTYAITVTVSGVDINGNPFTRTGTVSNGIWIVPSLPPGNYSITTLVVDRATGAIVLQSPAQAISVTTNGMVTPPTNDLAGTVQARGVPTTTFANARIYLYDDQNNLVGSTTADGQGNYVFHNLPPDNYHVIAVTLDGRAGRFDIPSIAQTPGTLVVQDDPLIDPFGVVFNSVAGTPLAGAVVRLVYSATGQLVPLPNLPDGSLQPNPVTTTVSGFYQFPLVPAGSFRLVVTPPAGYFWPSTNPNPSPVYTVTAASYGAGFTLSVGDLPLNVNFPLDLPTTLSLVKSGAPDPVQAGALLTYTLVVANSGGITATGVTITDVVPTNTTWASGGTYAGGIVSWSGLTVAASSSLTVTFAVTVTRPLPNGTVITNTNYSVDSNETNPVPGTPLTVTVSSGNIAGLVWNDLDGDGTRDGGEASLPGAVITLTWDSQAVTTTTDASGYYTFTGYPAGTYTVTEQNPSGYPLDTAPNVVPATITVGATTQVNFGDTPTAARPLEGIPAARPKQPCSCGSPTPTITRRRPPMPDGHADGHADAHADPHADAHADGHADPHLYANGDAYAAPAYADRHLSGGTASQGHWPGRSGQQDLCGQQREQQRLRNGRGR